MVGCGEARTASNEAIGFNVGFGQQRNNKQSFLTFFLWNTTSFLDAVRASPASYQFTARYRVVLSNASSY